MDIKAGKRPHTYPKVTKETVDAILKDIAEGGTRYHSAEANGICETHFYNLINQGKCDLSIGLNDTLCAYLVKSLRQIELKEIKTCRNDIKVSEKGHIGGQWTLEKVYWRHFGSNAEVKELSEEIERLKQQLHGVGQHDVDSENTQQNPVE